MHSFALSLVVCRKWEKRERERGAAAALRGPTEGGSMKEEKNSTA